MNNKVIITTGYMGSGSSAVTDLLSEYDGINCSNGSFEYVFMHCPNGLFDLEDKLLIGNNAIRSDEAIHTFLETMYGLYQNNGHWIANYKKRVSENFYNDCMDFVKGLSPFEFHDIVWYYQQNPVNYTMKAKLFLFRLSNKLTKGHLRITRPISYKNTMFAFPSKDQFYSAARQFVDRFLNNMGKNNSHIVLDQLLLPHNIYRLDRYFDNNTVVIVVDRDPRDVYLSNKYIWKKQNAMIPLPINAEEFCKMYKSIRKYVQDSSHQVLLIHFEDLIYNYDKTVGMVDAFLDIEEKNHLHKFEHFNPQLSKNNTQLFRRKEFYEDGIKLIEEELSEFLYPFPGEYYSSVPAKSLF